MADTNAILAQRFLESEGEMGRSFTRVMSKFGDLQFALAQQQQQQAASATTAADSSNAMASPVPAADTSAADSAFQSLMRDMDLLEYTLRHVRRVQDNAVQEMRNYDSQEAHTVSQIQASVTSLKDLQSELTAAKQWRSEQEEYERLAQQINAIPARPVTEANIAALAAGEQALVATRAGLMSELESKRSKHLLLSVAFEQLRAEWCAAERAEADATRSTREEAAAAAEAERRRAEEEALAYEAAAEAKASAEQAEEEEDGDEKKGDSMDGSGEGGEREEGEEGAIDDPSTPATNAGGSTPMADDAASSTQEGGLPSPTASTPADSPAASPLPEEDTAAPMET